MFRKFGEQTNHYKQHFSYINYIRKKNERFIHKNKDRESIVFVNENFLKSKFNDVHINITTAKFITTIT